MMNTRPTLWQMNLALNCWKSTTDHKKFGLRSACTGKFGVTSLTGQYQDRLSVALGHCVGGSRAPEGPRAPASDWRSIRNIGDRRCISVWPLRTVCLWYWWFRNDGWNDLKRWLELFVVAYDRMYTTWFRSPSWNPSPRIYKPVPCCVS